jgi:hypothetical protein
MIELKRYLPPVALTPEDEEINTLRVLRTWAPGWWDWLRNAQKQDTSDARIMLKLTAIRAYPLRPSARYGIPLEFQEDVPQVMLNSWNAGTKQ